ncbi:formate/nitrite transporter family protein [Archangium sp.]|uniref:formate/nitrite transporter family protein n=1 Tax=Archangium sp. TaxID=1872627 RepID=UPI003899AEDA
MSNDESPRLTAQEIYEHAVQAGRDELERPAGHLAFSGLAGGFVMGLSGLGVALVRSYLGDGELAKLASFVLYPAGFVAVIIGRAQLFTENTLFPVLVVLRSPSRLGRMFQLWGVVLASNLVGALLFSLLVSHTGALKPGVLERLGALGREATEHSTSELFWGAVVGGWLIALVAWLVSASHSTFGQLALIWFFTFIVGAGLFTHSIAGSSELMVAALRGELPVSECLRWLLAAVLGNAVGGVGLVSLLNYGQVEGHVEKATEEPGKKA